MKNNKKYIMLPLVAVAAIAAPIVVAVSCGSNKTEAKKKDSVNNKTLPDGTKINKKPDGTTVITNPDGTTTTVPKIEPEFKKSITEALSSIGAFGKLVVTKDSSAASEAIAQFKYKGHTNNLYPSTFKGKTSSTYDITLETAEADKIVEAGLKAGDKLILTSKKGIKPIKDKIAEGYKYQTKTGQTFQYYIVRIPKGYEKLQKGTTSNIKPYNGKITPKAVGKMTYNSSNNYYMEAQNLKGEALLKKLHEIQGKHTHGIGSYTGLYRTYATAFKDNIYEKDNSLIDLYSENTKGKDPYNYKSTDHGGNYKHEGDIYNREHVIPQSWFGKKHPMHDDAQMVWPSDGKVNGMRSNYPHAPVSSMSWESKNGSKLGTNSQFGGTVFEPVKEFKGDVARTYLYFAVAYWDSIVSHQQAKKVFTRSFPYMTSTYLQMYVKWAKEDPVDQFDMQRNVEIAKIQGNRNPFIDYPNLIDAIWGKDGKGTPTSTFKNEGVAMSIK